MDIRIRFQKIIETANQLPLPENHQILISKQPKTLQSIQKTKLELVKLLDQLSTMQEVFLLHSPHKSLDNTEISSKKRKWDFSQDNIDLNLIIKDLMGFQEAFIPKRDEIIAKWHQKVQSKTGGMVVQKKFKVINQSPLFQIQESLKSDLDRLIKRTQLKRSDYKILGLSDQSPPLDNTSNIDDHLSNYYPFIYDDNDFYQEMLKDLVDSRIADSGIIFILFNIRGSCIQGSKD